MRISDWSSDVCSSDLRVGDLTQRHGFEIGNALEEERLLLLHDLGRDLDDRALALVERLDQPVGVREAIRKPRLRCLVLRIGRASCRERVCQYVSISVVAVSLKKKRR